MNIGIDGISAIGKSGNATYTRELVRALLSVDTKDSYYVYTFLHDLFRESPLGISSKFLREKHTYLAERYFPLPNRKEVSHALLKARTRLNSIDVFHSTNPLYFAPLPVSTVVTVHDLSALYSPAWTKESSRVQFMNTIDSIVMNADAFIAVSEYTKRDIIEKLQIDSSNVTRIYEAASDIFFPDADTECILRTYGLSTFVLYAGQLQPRKNILNLIRAWKKASARVSGTALVLAGSVRDAAYAAEIEECIRTEGVSDSVIRVGSVDNSILRKLYSTAQCFIYPSFFEGFGLPVLESLACGTPVITSTTSSLPEVAGTAGLLVDPYDDNEIASAIEKMCKDHTLRERLAASAVPHAQSFTWRAAALQTIDVYKKISR